MKIFDSDFVVRGCCKYFRLFEISVLYEIRGAHLGSTHTPWSIWRHSGRNVSCFHCSKFSRRPKLSTENIQNYRTLQPM